MWSDLTFDPLDDRTIAFEDLNDNEVHWETLSTAPTKSALFYDASYNPRDVRATASTEFNNKDARWETVDRTDEVCLVLRCKLRPS